MLRGPRPKTSSSNIIELLHQISTLDTPNFLNLTFSRAIGIYQLFRHHLSTNSVRWFLFPTKEKALDCYYFKIVYYGYYSKMVIIIKKKKIRTHLARFKHLSFFFAASQRVEHWLPQELQKLHLISWRIIFTRHKISPSSPSLCRWRRSNPPHKYFPPSLHTQGE